MQSVVSYPDRGTYGKSSYRGNCSGRIIEDIIDQFKLRSLSDFMVGSGTTEDVVKARGLEGSFADLNRGFDMMTMDLPERAENIFWHPPYHNMVIYSGLQYSDKEIISKYGFDPKVNDLSRCKDWDDFVKKLNHCMLKQFAALEKGGRMFTLVGDMKRQGRLYSMLSDIAKPGTLEQVVIKMQHNCVSDSRSYTGSFIPIVHEYLIITRKDSGLIIPVSWGVHKDMDIRQSSSASWRDIIFAIVQENGLTSLEDIYGQLKDSPKASSNPHWKEKIRQVLQNTRYFTRTERGHYALAI